MTSDFVLGPAPVKESSKCSFQIMVTVLFATKDHSLQVQDVRHLKDGGELYRTLWSAASGVASSCCKMPQVMLSSPCRGPHVDWTCRVHSRGNGKGLLFCLELKSNE